jgi:hypothetical protein
MMQDTDNDEADEIRERIEDLDIVLEALRQTSETLAVFLRPSPPAANRKKLAEKSD